MPSPRYSLVVPFFNEEESIDALWAATVPVLAELDGSWEALLVNDGSRDGTAERLAAIAAAHPTQVRVLSFAENRGQAAALLDGLRGARGEIILTMDGDGQNDPGDYPMLLQAMQAEVADLVCGWRRDRHDSTLRRVMSRVANHVNRRLMGVAIHDSGCQLRVFRREVIGALFSNPLMQSFLPAMVAAAGFRVVERVARHHPRDRGESKYGLRRLWWRPLREMLAVRGELRKRRRAGAAGAVSRAG